MKIWCQSTSAIGKNPLWTPYEKTLENYLHKIVRPGTTVEIHGVNVMSTSTNWLSYAEYLNNGQIINNAMEAERQGFDAFALLCMDDPAFRELRQTVNIPIINAGETAFYMACQLSSKFALLGYNPFPVATQTEHAKQYGLAERMVAVEPFNITLKELAESFNSPEKVLKEVNQVARKARESGATMLVPGCGCLSMILVSNNIRQAEGLPIIDTAGVAVKMAEVLVDLKALGLDRSSLGPYTRVDKNELAAIRSLYGIK